MRFGFICAGLATLVLTVRFIQAAPWATTSGPGR